MMEDKVDERRRVLLANLMATGLLTACNRKREAVGDVAQTQNWPIKEIVTPKNGVEIQEALSRWQGPVCVGGGRFSMGGQIAQQDALHFDMRAMNRVLWVNTEKNSMRVEAGIRWRDLMDVIDPYDRSIAIMQSYSNFTVGGSMAVNCHGRYVGAGPIVNSILSYRLILADGRALEVSRDQHADLFAAAIGGYAGVGIITEVELSVARNAPIQRQVTLVALADYQHWFESNVASNKSILLHNADLIPPSFDSPLAISWVHCNKEPTVNDRLITRNQDYSSEKNAIWAISELPGGSWLRSQDQNKLLNEEQPIVWRNYEASLDVAALEPRTRLMSTYLLQEYFVPVNSFLAFARGMTKILALGGANVLNVSIRHSPADNVSVLRWAREDVFCFVLYYKQRNSDSANSKSGKWTRALIDLALKLGGRYYLPYQNHATLIQFRQAYPEYKYFRELKREFDPSWRFRNHLWDKYLPHRD